jgi:glycosyltransferase involved in cell wall biosynthesis
MRPLSPTAPVRHIAMIGNFPPRRCGIATFTADLQSALARANPSLGFSMIAMNDPHQQHSYPSSVGYEICQNHPDNYIAAAAHINALNPDVVSIQHEFGIFGGVAGEYLLELTEPLRAPIVITLHTVLSAPSEEQRRVMRALAAHSSRLVVMTRMGREILTSTLGVPRHKIAVIPHGIPDLPFLDSAVHKCRFSLEDRKVVLTFGLLSPNKGIETMIEALPSLAATHPDLIYVVVGATHPHLLANEGEAYRDRLKARAEQLRVSAHLRFVNEYVDTATLQAWLCAADIYVTPYLNEAQITSGTLSYAVGLGKAVVSTPYWHARELLADGTGVFVPFCDVMALADSIGALLSDRERRDQLRRRAYRAGRQMIWPVVAQSYLDLFGAARTSNRFYGKVLNLRPAKNASHASTLAAIDRMTDDCGMLQHSRSSVPDRRHGYCLDDNARALMLAVELGAEGVESERAARIAGVCASFVDAAWDEETLRFRNFMDYRRDWLEKQGSDDSHGRALWALGRVAAATKDPGLKLWATTLADGVISASDHLESPRAMTFAILGLCSYLAIYPGHRPARRLLEAFATRLHDFLRQERRDRWTWFEPVLAYDNARLPEALIRAGRVLGQDAMTSEGLAALHWLVELQTSDKMHFRPVGTESYGQTYSAPRAFDQQPVEAWATIEACLGAIEATGGSEWIDHAEAAFAWYLGQNDLGLRLATAAGGCYDGLQIDRVNLNQGAESILSFQFSVAVMRRLKRAARAVPHHANLARTS